MYTNRPIVAGVKQNSEAFDTR